MRVRSLGRGDPLEKGVATHSSILALEIPWIQIQYSFCLQTLALHPGQLAESPLLGILPLRRTRCQKNKCCFADYLLWIKFSCLYNVLYNCSSRYPKQYSYFPRKLHYPSKCISYAVKSMHTVIQVKITQSYLCSLTLQL